MGTDIPEAHHMKAEEITAKNANTVGIEATVETGTEVNTIGTRVKAETIDMADRITTETGGDMLGVAINPEDTWMALQRQSSKSP